MREPTKIVQFVEMLQRKRLPLATALRKLRREQGRSLPLMGLAVTGFGIPPNMGK
jgi:hypothetical protein